MSIISSCKLNQDEKIIEETIISIFANDSTHYNDNSVPKGPKLGASKLKLYTLAWQQFIALN